jgi:hypothetical protein
MLVGSEKSMLGGYKFPWSNCILLEGAETLCCAAPRWLGMVRNWLPWASPLVEAEGWYVPMVECLDPAWTRLLRFIPISGRECEWVGTPG